jgi:hypothetical protein
MGNTEISGKLLRDLCPPKRAYSPPSHSRLGAFSTTKTLFFYLSFIILTSSFVTCQAQSDSLRPNYRALRWLLAGESVAYSASIYGLSKAWYKTPFTNFSVKDDFHEWKQFDKVGHFFTAYQICRHTAAVYKNTGITNRQAALYGALSGFLFLTPIELLDGFQYPTYGFSPSDMVANVMGHRCIWDSTPSGAKSALPPNILFPLLPSLRFVLNFWGAILANNGSRITTGKPIGFRSI